MTPDTELRIHGATVEVRILILEKLADGWTIDETYSETARRRGLTRTQCEQIGRHYGFPNRLALRTALDRLRADHPTEPTAAPAPVSTTRPRPPALLSLPVIAARSAPPPVRHPVPAPVYVPKPKRPDGAARAWAKAHGVACPPSGRVPQVVIDAYLARDPDEEPADIPAEVPAPAQPKPVTVADVWAATGAQAATPRPRVQSWRPPPARRNYPPTPLRWDYQCCPHHTSGTYTSPAAAADAARAHLRTDHPTQAKEANA